MLKRNDNGEAAAEFFDKRRQWRSYLSTRADLSDRGFRVGYWLSDRMNGNDQCCWYTVGRVAHEMGKSKSYVNRAIAELRAKNVVLVIEEKGKPNTYFLHAPFFLTPVKSDTPTPVKSDTQIYKG